MFKKIVSYNRLIRNCAGGDVDTGTYSWPINFNIKNREKDVQRLPIKTIEPGDKVRIAAGPF